jgi:hypothetical protein
MLRIFTCISAAILMMAVACKKGTPVEQQSFGFVKAELLLLPGTPSLEVYMENTKLSDTLVAGGQSKTQVVTAGKKTKISFRKVGSDVVLLDTSVVIDGGQNMSLRLAFSEDLGIKGFLKGKPSFGADSVSIQLLNKLPEELQADSLLVNAVLFRLNNMTGEFEEITSFENFPRTKLHPKSVVLPLKDESAIEITYFIRFRNAKTGEFLVDGLGSDLAVIGGFEPGKEHILTMTSSFLDPGDGSKLYFYTIDPVIL